MRVLSLWHLMGWPHTPPPAPVTCVQEVEGLLAAAAVGATAGLTGLREELQGRLLAQDSNMASERK